MKKLTRMNREKKNVANKNTDKGRFEKTAVNAKERDKGKLIRSRPAKDRDTS